VTALTVADLALLTEARRASLATIAPDGRPRLVPVCYALVDDTIWIALDEKPKTVEDVRDLARVRDVLARPDASLLVDRWSEDWTALAWVRLHGTARLVEPDDVPGAIIPALRDRYPQYDGHALEAAPMLAIAVERVTRWSAGG
jgi:PPOX class probable F420-dependent enzyme